MRKIYLICAILVLTACSSEPSNNEPALNTRIINGTDLAVSQSPQMVEVIVKYLSGEEGGCSGTVIGKNSILTAAHCVLGETASIFVRNNNLISQVSEVFTPDSFRIDANLKAIFDDIAVLKTTDFPLPALGILVNQAVLAGDILNIYGFGLDEDGNSGKLKSGQTSVDFVTENHIFGAIFNGEGSNTCNGDSGGPAVLKFNDANGQVGYGIVGVVSTGTSTDCQDHDATLYTNIQNPRLLGFLLNTVPDLIIY